MRAAVVFAVAALAGCHAADPCSGVSGTCVTLTVQSSPALTIDTLRIAASGAVTGLQTSGGGRAALPIKVALKLPASASGALHLDVDGVLGGNVVGSGATDTTVSAGQHSSASCTLVGNVIEGGDMAGGAADLSSSDLAGDAGMAAPPCDPAGVTGPQCVWRWQTPLPQGEAIIGVVAPSDARTLALTIDGRLIARDAVGWTFGAAPAMGGSVLSLGSSLFASGQDVYAAGDIQTGTTAAYGVLHSSDGAITWTQEPVPASVMQLGIGATSGATAILPVSGSTVLVRNAGAGTWATQTVGTASWSAASLTNASDAVVVGASGSNAAIAWSSDYTTWNTTPSITPSNQTLSGVCFGNGFGNPSSYWAVGNAVILHAAGPHPATWTQQGASVTGGLYLRSCVATDATHAWAFGSNGAVVATTDGVNWTGLAPLGTTQLLSAGAHSPATALTLVGNGGVIYRSVNGTSFTAEQSGPNDPLAAVFGVAAKTVFAVGPAGAILRTADDGATWSKLAVPAATGTTANLVGVWGSSATDVFAVGTGAIVHSGDGITFTKFTGASVPSTVNFSDVFGSALGVYAVGNNSAGNTRVVFRSTDKGTSFSPITITGFTGATGTALTVFALDGDVWVGGDNGTIWHSTNGTDFTSQPTGSTSPILRLRGAAGYVLAALQSFNGDYLRSINNGAWTPGTGPWTEFPDQIYVQPSDGTTFLFGNFGSPYVSKDKGATWTFLDTGIVAPRNLHGGFSFAANDIFLVGDTGIVHYGN